MTGFFDFLVPKRKIKGYNTPRSQFSKKLFEKNAPDSAIKAIHKSLTKKDDFKDSDSLLEILEILPQKALSKKEVEKQEKALQLFDLISQEGGNPEWIGHFGEMLDIDKKAAEHLIQDPDLFHHFLNLKIGAS